MRVDGAALTGHSSLLFFKVKQTTNARACMPVPVPVPVDSNDAVLVCTRPFLPFPPGLQFIAP